MMTQVLTGIQRTFTGTGRARALGTYTTALSRSAIVGQVLGGLIVSANIFGAEWRPVFLVNIPVGFGVAILSYSVLPGERGLKTGRLDVRGASLLAFGLLVLGVSLIYSHEYQPWNWTGLGASILVFWGLLSQLLIASTHFAVLFVMSLHLRRQLRWSPTAASFELLPWVAAFGVGGWVMARLPERARQS